MANKIRIAVLMGGPSAEHDISLKSGRMVLKYLDKKKYRAKAVVISKNGEWPIDFVTLKKNFDLAFIAMHGEYGEDGTLQKILERHQIPYTGSDWRASRLGMDKLVSLSLFKKAGLNVPRLVRRKFPMVVKPVDRGSSVGVSIVYSPRDLPRAIALAQRYSPRIMRQEFIKGREVTDGVIEVNGKLKALPPTEIISKASPFFDYRAKYQKGACDEITPARLPSKLIKQIQQTAIMAHKAIGARGFSRTDMIIENCQPPHTKCKIYVLEINTIPGLTATSLLPQQAKAAGISFTQLLDFIIEAALSRC